MDDHYHQPIWPMLEGALDYILNLAGEAWAMIRPPNETAREQQMREMRNRSDQDESVVAHVAKAVKGRNAKERMGTAEASANKFSENV
ncbi:Nn.00g117790.m01.CDS01 [Neocucurbitaria sp. VM-36]